mgnify:CR=1 FL=1
MSKPKARRGKRAQSKAAQATAQKRAERAQAAAAPKPSEAFLARGGQDQPVEAVEFKGSSGGGTLMRMRGGFQELAGQGEAKKQPSWVGRLVWLAALGAAAFFVLGQSR